MIKKLINTLKDKKLTISLAESMTGGYLSSEITKVSGASHVFKGAIICYSNETKINILKVDYKLINKYSVVSKEVSAAMAIGLSDVIKSDIQISITGNAGPLQQEYTNEFNAFFTIRFKNKKYTEEIIFKNNKRVNNIKRTKNIIIRELMKIIEMIDN